jgi:peroxiredoxin
MKYRFIHFLLLVTSFSLSFLCRGQASFEQRFENFKKELTGKPIKAFRLTALDNNTWDSDKLKGKVIVLNFWFTACKPCILEMPHLNKLVNEYKDNPVVFIAPAPETDAQIKKFLKKYSFDYHIIPSSLEYITALGVENFPTHLVIDKEGIVRQVFIGYADDIKEKLQAEIDKLVKK